MSLQIANKIKLVPKLGYKSLSMQFPNRFKGTIVEKLKNYVVQIKSDYQEVIVDSFNTMKSKPIKSSIYGSLTFAIYYCCKNNPDETSLTEQLQYYEREMSMVALEMQNTKSSDHLKYLVQCRNEGVLRRLSIGVVSFLWISDFNPELASFKAMCEHLNPQYSTFHERIVDVGFLNKFWKLDDKMRDYDINY